MRWAVWQPYWSCNSEYLRVQGSKSSDPRDTSETKDVVVLGNLVRLPVCVCVAMGTSGQNACACGRQANFTDTCKYWTCNLEPYSGQSGQIPSPCGRQTGHTYTYTPIQASTGHATLGMKFKSWAIWADSLSMWQTTTLELTHIHIAIGHATLGSLSCGQSGQIASPYGRNT